MKVLGFLFLSSFAVAMPTSSGGGAPLRLPDDQVISSSSSINSTHSVQELPLLRRLPDSSTILTLVFDLDETLVFNRHTDDRPATLRPHVIDVLAALRQDPRIEIVLWTASTRETALPVVEQLEQQGSVFHEIIVRDNRWYFDALTYEDGMNMPVVYTKDLRRLGRNTNRVVIVENWDWAVRLQPSNAILVENFEGQSGEDRTLLNLLPVVQHLINHIEEGGVVADALNNRHERLESLLGIQNILLPNSWQGVDLFEHHRLLWPPHGPFVKLFSNRTNTACSAAAAE
jgi:hypothetical protein